MEKDLTVRRVNGTGGRPMHDMCLELLEQKRFVTDAIITSTITLDELLETFERLLKLNADVKIIVKFD